jgi:hypothetical protein
MEDSVKLTDTQRRLLTAASQRDDRALERPSNLTGGVAGKVTAKLLAESLVEEIQSSTLSEQNVANDCNWACGTGTSSILIMQNCAECGTALRIRTLISTWVCNNADDRSTDFQQGEKCQAAPRRQSRFAV